MKRETYDIIELTPAATQYYGDSLKLPKTLLKDGNLVKASSLAIPVGHSRYGGPVADLPAYIKCPDTMRFAAQLDLKQISPFDKSGLLPKSGHLFFFADIVAEMGRVIYADIASSELVRVVEDHDDNFYAGVLIEKATAATEKLSDRYREAEDEEEAASTGSDGKIWDYFSGSKQSKIFGIYTNCQLEEEDILDLLDTDQVVLLQIGENGFNEEGVFSVLITKSDLEARNFANCTFSWAQS